MKHVTRKEWIRRANMSASTTMPTSAIIAEIEVRKGAWNNAPFAWNCMGAERPPGRTFTYRCRQWQATYFHDGTVAGINEIT